MNAKYYTFKHILFIVIFFGSNDVLSIYLSNNTIDDAKGCFSTENFSKAAFEEKQISLNVFASNNIIEMSSDSH